MDYVNKTVLITGASSSVGESLITFFAQKKANLIITYYTNKDLVHNLKNKLEKAYHVHIDDVFLDLCDEKSIQNLAKYSQEKYGKIDILINNAALSLDSFYFDKTKEEFMKVLEINTVGTFLMIKEFDKFMDDGYIFNMSSTDGIDTGNVYSIDYNASKAALINMTKTIALVSKNKIVCICPNWIDTKSTRKMNKKYLKDELKRIGQISLINPNTISKIIDDCIKKDVASGSVIRIEGEEDVRRVNY